MMKNLLEHYFGKHYHSPKQCLVEYMTLHGQFNFADSKACDDCKRHTPDTEAECNKTVFICDSGEVEIEVIYLEKFLNAFTHLKAIPSGKKCDLLLIGLEKIVFCDMTCSLPKYINPFRMADGTEKIGKRNTVRIQIDNSIAMLADVPEIANLITNKTEKVALFAYREKTNKQSNSFDDIIQSNFRAFNIVETKVFQVPMYSNMSNGFLFTEIKYPNKYTW